MKFKTPEIQRRWLEARKRGKLQALAVDVENELRHFFHLEPVMTEASRTRAETIALYGDPAAPISTHETEIKQPDGSIMEVPLGAFDIRSRDDHGNEYPWVPGLVKTINKRWTYDPARPEKMCAVYHDIGKGKHLHLQVSEKTIFRGMGTPA